MRLLWSQTVTGGPRGLVLAREKNQVLVWDEGQTLSLFHLLGQLQSQRRLSGTILHACAADDGSSFVAVSTAGELWWLAPDLTIRWQQKLSCAVLAVALDSYGNYLALADERGRVNLITRAGERLLKLACARPLRHLAFAPGMPIIFGSADYGLVCAMDLLGHWRWRDGLVAHVGSLAVRGTDAQVVLSCFSSGLQRYQADGRNLGATSVNESCQLVAISFDGQRTLVVGPTQLHLLAENGQVLATHRPSKPVLAVALTALGEHAVVAQAGGPVMGLEVNG